MAPKVAKKCTSREKYPIRSADGSGPDMGYRIIMRTEVVQKPEDRTGQNQRNLIGHTTAYAPGLRRDGDHGVIQVVVSRI